MRREADLRNDRPGIGQLCGGEGDRHDLIEYAVFDSQTTHLFDYITLIGFDLDHQHLVRLFFQFLKKLIQKRKSAIGVLAHRLQGKGLELIAGVTFDQTGGGGIGGTVVDGVVVIDDHMTDLYRS